MTEIEKYDRAMPSDEDDDNEEGNIGADVVATAHFGGGTISDTETAASKRLGNENSWKSMEFIREFKCKTVSFIDKLNLEWHRALKFQGVELIDN